MKKKDQIYIMAIIQTACAIATTFLAFGAVIGKLLKHH